MKAMETFSRNVDFYVQKYPAPSRISQSPWGPSIDPKDKTLFYRFTNGQILCEADILPLTCIL